MGGGGMNIGGYFPASFGGMSYVDFELVITRGKEIEVWNICQEEDSVDVQDSGAQIPVLEVLLHGSQSIGVVPPDSARIIAQSLRNVRRLSGKILAKVGNSESPRIMIRVYL